MKLKTLQSLIIVLLCLGALRTAVVLRNQQDQRRPAQTREVILQAIHLNAERTPTPSPTPNRDTMHVTQRSGREDPGMIVRILDLLHPQK